MPRKKLFGLLALALLLAVLVSAPFAATALAQSPEDGEPAPSSEEETPPPPTPTPTPDPKDDDEEPDPRRPILPPPGPTTRTITITPYQSPLEEGGIVRFVLKADIPAVLDLTINVRVEGGESFLAETPVNRIGMAAGDDTAWLILSTVDDNAYEANDTVTATVLDGSRYDPGVPSSAPIDLINDDPPTPKGVRATVLSRNSIRVNWTAVPPPGVNRYMLERREGRTGDWDPVSEYVYGTERTAYNLKCNTTYYFRVRSRGDGVIYDNKWSQPSIEEDAKTHECPDAPAPESLTATGFGRHSVSISWSAVTDAPDNKVEYRESGSQAWIRAATVFYGTSYAKTGLDCNTIYEFQVTARGNGYPLSDNYANPSSVSQKTRLCLPPAPGNLTVTSATQETVSLSWDEVSGTFRYRVEYLADGESEWSTDRSFIYSTNRKVPELECGTSYDFRVSVLGDGTTWAYEWSDPSGTVDATTAQCVPTVTIEASDTSITEGQNAVFTLRARPAPSSGLVVSIDVTEDGSFLADTPPTSVTIPGGSASFDLTLGTVNDTVDENHGSVSVSVIDGPGDGYIVGSAGTETATVAIRDNDDPVVDPVRPGKVPLPTGTREDGSATVSWDAPSNGGSAITSYEVQYKVTTDSSWTSAAPVAVTSATLSNLIDGNAYHVQVRACNAVGCGAWSDSATIPSVPTVTIEASDTSITEGQNAVFTLRARPAPSSGLVVSIDVTEDGSFLADTPPTSVTIPGGSASFDLTLGTVNDTVDENHGSVSVSVIDGPGDGYIVGSAGTETATVAIRDNDDPVVDPVRPGKVPLPTGTREDGSATVSWDAPSNGGSAITSYEVQYKVTTDSSWTSAAPVAVTSATLSNLIDGNAYHVQVRACNAVGCGAWSDSATIPSVPTVTIEASDTSITEGQNAVFTLRARPAPSPGLVVSIDVTEDGSFLADTPPTSVTIPGGSASFDLTLGTVNDTVDENHGSVSVSVIDGPGDGYIVGSAGTETATVAIRDNDDPVVDPVRPGKVPLPTGTREDGSATVSWDAPSNGGSAITSYEVQYKVTTDSSWTSAAPVAVTSATLSNLIDGNAYHVQVRACNAVGCGAWSDSATIPSVPTVTIEASDTSITEGQNAVFTLRARPAPSSGLVVSIDVTEDGSFLADTPPTSVTIPGGSASFDLTLGTVNDTVDENHGSVSVSVIDGPGDGYIVGSAGTETATVAIRDNDDPVVDPVRPGKVPLPTGTREDGSATVSWDAPSNGGSAITSYEVQYKVTTDSSWTSAAPVAVTSATLSNLIDGNAYHVQVRACNAVGCGAWSDSATIRTPPGKVSPPTGTGGPRSLRVRWSVPSNGGSAITSYRVQHKRTSLSWPSTYQSVGGSTTETTITGLTDGTPYHVHVRACNTVGCGAWSNVIILRVPAPPSKVLTPTLTGINGTLSVSWSAPSNGGSAITSYRVQHKRTSLSWPSTYQRVSGSTTETTITGLTDGTPYHVHVRACNAAGCGAWSDSATGTPIALAAPTGLRSTASDGSVTLTWNPATNAEEYVVYQWHGPSLDFLPLPFVDPTTGSKYTIDGSSDPVRITGTTVTIGGLTNGGGYSHKVSSKIGSAESELSQQFDTTLKEKLGTPTGLNVTPLPRREVRLSWNSIAGEVAATRYIVEAREEPNGTWTAVTVPFNQTNYNIDLDAIVGSRGLAHADSYQLRVKATDLFQAQWPSDGSVEIAIRDTPITVVNGDSRNTFDDEGNATGKAVVKWSSVPGVTEYSLRWRKLPVFQVRPQPPERVPHTDLRWHLRPPVNDEVWSDPATVPAGTLEHTFYGLAPGEVYAIQLNYRFEYEPVPGATVTRNGFSAREAFVWPSKRAAGLGKDLAGERVATFPLSYRLLDNPNYMLHKKRYSYIVCEDTFPEGTITRWKEFIDHAAEQWEIATDYLIDMERLERDKEGNKLKCVDYSEHVESIRNQVASFIEGDEPTLGEIESHVEDLVKAFRESGIDSAKRRRDYVLNEVMMIIDTDDNDPLLASVKAFIEVAEGVGHGWCVYACASSIPTFGKDGSKIITTDIRFRGSKFTNVTLEVPGPDRTASKGDVRFNTCGTPHYDTVVHEFGHALGIGGGKGKNKDERGHPQIYDAAMSYHRVPDCSPHPFDVMAIYALYQTVD